MMIGNSMTATVLAGRRLTEELRDKRDEVEARLALGQASRQAAAPTYAPALRAALTPQIETTKAIGLVFLPGVMTGLIRAGVRPCRRAGRAMRRNGLPRPPTAAEGAGPAFRSAGVGAYGVMFWLMWKRLPGS